MQPLIHFFTRPKRVAKKPRVRKPRAQSSHYLKHKEAARALVVARIAVLNQTYGFRVGRIAIRNQKTCWGSCSSLGNLNFNYRILFLPPHLQEYVIVHELCHLAEFNHGKNFWTLVARVVPEYRAHKRELARVRMQGGVMKVE